MTGVNGKPDRVQWSPIAPLRDDEVGIDFSEVDGLRRQWLEVKERVESSNPLAYKQFNDELSREWAIETGIIEGIYELNHGITQTLIQRGFMGQYVEPGSTNMPADELIAILNDHVAAIEEINTWIEESHPLTVWFIRNLHQAIARNQTTYDAIDQFGSPLAPELHRGKFKSMSNNPTRPDGVIHEYCPPEQVDSEIDNLVEWYNSYDSSKQHPITVGAWLHHRFTQIHPFEDGNGRVARALLTWHLVRKGLLPIVVTRDLRIKYINSLERADAGDLAPFIDILIGLEKETLLNALSVEHGQIEGVDTVEEVMGFILDGVRGKQREQEERLRSVHQSAIELRQYARDLLNEESNRIASQFQESLGLNMFSNLDTGGPDEGNEYFYRSEVVETAKETNHWVNLQEPRYFIKVSLRDSESPRSPVMVFVISLHSIGRSQTGVIGATSFIKLYPSSQGYDEDQGGSIDNHEFSVCNPEAFILTVSDDVEDLKPRFERWVKLGFSVGLRIWGQTFIEQA